MAEAVALSRRWRSREWWGVLKWEDRMEQLLEGLSNANRCSIIDKFGWAHSLRAHRAWHYGDDTLSPQEVRATASSLRTAARNGDRVSIRSFVRAAAASLRAASRNGDRVSIRSFVRSSREGVLDVGDPEGAQSAALHVAVMCRQTDAVLELLTLGTSPDVRDASSCTPLHSAGTQRVAQPKRERPLSTPTRPPCVLCTEAMPHSGLRRDFE
ncbi:hypothetical protein T484DRAFT_1908198 [Baffinella frigidus]|nr:hypothetical protein T484DRAFT_1908198 [Cryptophyta sp. CCMP2293]